MFEGSAHHDRGYFQPLQGAGAALNGSTNADRTNYWEVVPTERARAGAVDGIGSHGIPAARADRGEVREPARRGAERAPPELREPPVRACADGDARGAVPARSSVPLADDRRAPTTCAPRGSTTCASSSAATTIPANASLAIAGDIDTDEALALAERYFGDIPAGPGGRSDGAPTAALPGETRLVLEDRVELPRLYLAWHSPAIFAPGDAELDLVADVLGERQDLAPVPAPGLRAADRDRRQRRAAVARAWRLLPGGGDRGAGPHARRAGRVDRRRDRRAGLRRPDRRRNSSAASRRPRRSSCSGCRRSAASAASRIS